jgi:hypothetical protein
MARPRKIPPPPMGDPVVTEVRHDGGLVEVTCITHNVHLGDGRKLHWQESARVTEELAAFLEERGQVKRG